MSADQITTIASQILLASMILFLFYFAGYKHGNRVGRGIYEIKPPHIKCGYSQKEFQRMVKERWKSYD